MPNDRSEAALRERLEIAGKATKGPWYHVLAAIVGTKESPDDDNATCICFTEWGASGDPQANAAHIAASSPDVVREDIEEILRLRGEVKRLRDENEALKNSAFEFGVGFSTKVNEMRAREEWLSRELARLNKEADWLVRMLSLYTEDCPLKFSWVYAEKLPIPKIDDCEGTWSVDDCFHCSGRNPGQCWRKAARKAAEEKERYG